jgi:hypothetical protein
MKKTLTLILITLFIFGITTAVFADVWVNGYQRSDGTYVKGHWRSDPDGNFWNNYSTKGNINPYTGKEGTISYESYLSDKYNIDYDNYDYNFGDYYLNNDYNYDFDN